MSSGLGCGFGGLGGAVHSLKCTNPMCASWIPIWLPSSTPESHLTRDLICGFCAAQKIAEQTNDLAEWKDGMLATVENLKTKQKQTMEEIEELKVKLNKEGTLGIEEAGNLKELAKELQNSQGSEKNLEETVGLRGETKNLQTKPKVLSAPDVEANPTCVGQKVDARNLTECKTIEIATKFLVICQQLAPGQNIETLLGSYDPSTVGIILQEVLWQAVDNPKLWSSLIKKITVLAKRPDLATMDAILSGFQLFVSEIGDLRNDYLQSLSLVEAIGSAVSQTHPSPLEFLRRILEPLKNPPNAGFAENYSSSKVRETDARNVFASCVKKIAKAKGNQHLQKEWQSNEKKFLKFLRPEQNIVSLGMEFLLPVRVAIRSFLYAGVFEEKRLHHYASNDSPVPMTSSAFAKGVIRGVCDFCFDSSKVTKVRAKFQRCRSLVNFIGDILGELAAGKTKPFDFLLKRLTPLKDTGGSSSTARETGEDYAGEVFASCVKKMTEIKSNAYVNEEWKKGGRMLEDFVTGRQTVVSLGIEVLVPVRAAVGLLLEKFVNLKRIVKFTNETTPVPKESEEFIRDFVDGVYDYCFADQEKDQWKVRLEKLLPIFLESFGVVCNPNRYSSTVAQELQVKLIFAFHDALKSRGFSAWDQMVDVLSVLRKETSYHDSSLRREVSGYTVTSRGIQQWAKDCRAEKEAGRKFLFRVAVGLLLEERANQTRIVKYAKEEAPVAKESDEFIQGLVEGSCDYCFVAEKGIQWKANLKKLLPIFLELFGVVSEPNKIGLRSSTVGQGLQLKLMFAFQDVLKSRGFRDWVQMGDILSVLGQETYYYNSHDKRLVFGYIVTSQAVRLWLDDNRAQKGVLRSCAQ